MIRGQNQRSRFAKNLDSEDQSRTISKLIQGSRKSGRLNLSGHSLTSLPSEIWTANTQNQVVDHSFDRVSTAAESWWEVTDLQRLIAADNLLASIDSQITMLHQLKMLDLRGNKIEVIPDLSNLEMLTVVNLSMNKLKLIPHSFLSLPLVELDLHGNQITEFPNDFCLLDRLSVLNMSTNTIKTIPKMPTSIQKMDLSQNCITELSTHVFVGLDSLSELDLSHNNISCINAHAPTTELVSLTVFDVKNNNLTCWDWFIVAPGLKALTLAFNKLSSIGELPNSIESLDMRDNSIIVFPESILSLKELSRLDISNNNIASILPELGLLRKLRTLSFTGNPLKGLPEGTEKVLETLRNRISNASVLAAVKSIPAQVEVVHIVEAPDESGADADNQYPQNLHDLDLSFKKLAQIPSLSLNHLCSLDLSRNLLKSVNFSGGLPNLEHLKLDNNQIIQLDFNCAFPRLIELHLGCNNIKSINIEELLVWFPTLNVLDISNNDISLLPPRLALMKLNTLIVSGNPFRVPRPAIVQRGTFLFMIRYGSYYGLFKGSDSILASVIKP